ncbi:MAG: hypothetical protein ACRDO8_01405 [Nocardioidaceae bacterium]
MTDVVSAAARVVLAVDPEDVKPGWTAFIVVVLLGVALAFLLRSFTKQLKKVDFEEKNDRDEDNRPEQPGDDGPTR